MSSQIFVNLPVKDLDRSVAFFTQLGYTFNPQFTDENATCMIVHDNIFVMLLVVKYFLTFTDKQLCDTSRHREVILALSFESRARVDELATIAAANGATPGEPKDLGFMYQRSYEDLDGHLWELFHMDAQAMPQG